MIPCWLNVNHAGVISLGCRFVKEVGTPTGGCLAEGGFRLVYLISSVREVMGGGIDCAKQSVG